MRPSSAPARAFAQGALIDVLLKAVRERTQLAVQRNDFKLEQLPPHLFMNFRVVDEHGRQLGMGRNLAALKAELGGQARSAFQALAALKLPCRRAAIAARCSCSRRAGAARPPSLRRLRRTTRRSATPPGPSANLPELMEIRRGSQSLVGFPALIDRGDACRDRGLRRARCRRSEAPRSACADWWRCS